MFLGDLIGGIADAVGLGGIGDAIGGITDMFNPIGLGSDIISGVFGGMGGGMGIGDLLGGANKIMDQIPGLSDISKLVGNLFGDQSQTPSVDVSQPLPMKPILPEKGKTSGGGSLNDLLASLAGKADSMYSDMESAVNNLDPKSKTYQQDLQKIQMQMGQYNQMTQMMSNLQKDLDDMNMSIIRNLKT